ncbi:sodium/glutamate symporter [Methyloprofundus sp.]|uniref:sodium/glutamate symporter n=1 Tax=Methyloprofundus sp. TaxID=2020875 RepID=UPI003D0EBDBA
MNLDLDPIWTLAIAILVLYLGTFVISRVGFLRNNNIPVPVVGGVLFALLTSILYAQYDIRLHFDMSMKDPMMLMFFTTIGLSADLRMLKQGGPQLLIFALVCLLYLIIQDGLGLLTAISMDLHPLVGLLGGSITLSGGHGTGAAYAQKFADVQNIAGVMELALACATFGLIIGGIIGGPVAGRLIRKRALQPDENNIEQNEVQQTQQQESPISTDTLLQTLFYVLLCLIGGRALAASMAGAAFTLPGFVWCLFIGVAIRNSDFLGPFLKVHRATVDTIGSLSLSIFLAMALMSLRLWELLDLAGPLLVLLSVQTLGMVLFASFITFRIMGSHYDAAIVAGGHCGFGLGATPTAVANMKALTLRYGASPQAFLVVPLMGAFFIDFLNALVIQAYLALPLFGF